MIPTELFVYGTLRHDQPEHARYCRGVTGWRLARLRAQLWMLPQGYRLAVVPAAAVLLTATHDAIADETRRAAIAPETLAHAAVAAQVSWLEGEVISFRDIAEAWPPLDRWEEFTPGGSGAYARAVVPVEYDGQSRSTWAYVATQPPPGSLRVNS